MSRWGALARRAGILVIVLIVVGLLAAMVVRLEDADRREADLLGRVEELRAQVQAQTVLIDDLTNQVTALSQQVRDLGGIPISQPGTPGDQDDVPADTPAPDPAPAPAPDTAAGPPAPAGPAPAPAPDPPAPAPPPAAPPAPPPPADPPPPDPPPADPPAPVGDLLEQAGDTSCQLLPVTC